MSLLAWPALLLLAVVPLMVWLAVRARQPRRVNVGSLLLWRRLPQELTARASRRGLDPLLWLLIAAAVLASAGAARPALAGAGDAPTAAVFVEPGFAGGTDVPADLRARAAEAAPGAELEFHSSPPELAGDISGALAWFETRTHGVPSRLLFLWSPAAGADRLGRVLPRVTAARPGTVFAVRSEGNYLVLSASPGVAPEVEGARWEESRDIGQGGHSPYASGLYPHVEHVFTPVADRLIWNGVTLARRPFLVGVGPDWRTPAHAALYAALGATEGNGAPEIWLGAREQEPAVRVNLGEAADLAGAAAALDPGHQLFAELPLDAFDWLAAGHLLPDSPGARPLIRAVREGEVLGDIARLRGRALEFAGDPFSDAPVSAAALLLDNAVGVLTGERPSERTHWHIEAGTLPTRRAALAQSFVPYGEAAAHPPHARLYEAATWLLLLAAACALAAGWLATTRSAKH
jgi:hypothetical protein